MWYDLITEDAGAVVPFYQDLFGWKVHLGLRIPDAAVEAREYLDDVHRLIELRTAHARLNPQDSTSDTAYRNGRPHYAAEPARKNQPEHGEIGK